MEAGTIQEERWSCTIIWGATWVEPNPNPLWPTWSKLNLGWACSGLVGLAPEILDPHQSGLVPVCALGT